MMRKQTIWLVMDEYGPQRMTKRQPTGLGRREHPVKVEVSWDERALRPPILETSIKIEDWRQGLDVADVEMRQPVITATERDAIIRMRREAMVAQMRDMGYTVIEPEAPDGQAKAD